MLEICCDAKKEEEESTRWHARYSSSVDSRQVAVTGEDDVGVLAAIKCNQAPWIAVRESGPKSLLAKTR
jgi:hypothetical protein